MVKFWKSRKHWDKPFSEKVARRVARIPSHDLLTWSDQALTGVSQALSAYGRNQTPENLAELSTGAEALYALIYEMDKRSNASF